MAIVVPRGKTLLLTDLERMVSREDRVFFERVVSALLRCDTFMVSIKRVEMVYRSAPPGVNITATDTFTSLLIVFTIRLRNDGLCNSTSLLVYR